MTKTGFLATRRKLLATIGLAGGAAVLGRSAFPTALLAQDQADAHVSQIVADAISVDMHNHVSQAKFPNSGGGQRLERLDGELSKLMRASGLTALCSTYAVDSYRSPKPGDWYRYHLQSLAYSDRVLARNGMRRALSIGDIKTAHAAGVPIIIQDCEGAQWIEGHLERIEEAYKRGLRHLQLLHQMHDIVAPLGGVQQLVVPAGYSDGTGLGSVTGLTEMGANVIKECNRLGIVVDLAHADEETGLGALKIAQQPLVLSHTALASSVSKTAENYERNPGLAARLVSEAYAKEVAKVEGVVGVWHTFPTIRDFVTGLKQMADVVGVDHTGIGTDTSMTSAAGGTNNVWPDERGGFLYAVVTEMLAQGFSADETVKIVGGNYLRVFEKATDAHA